MVETLSWIILWLVYWKPLLSCCCCIVSTLHSPWERSRSLPNLEDCWTFLNKIHWGYSQDKLFCAFCVCLYVCRVNKLADSQTDVRPSQSHQKRRQDMEQNVSVSRSHERPVFPSLNETANIKFNTGVSIFTKNVNLVCLAQV